MTDADRIALLRAELQNIRDLIEANDVFTAGRDLWNAHQQITRALAATEGS
jgi:hypothetical protein